MPNIYKCFYCDKICFTTYQIIEHFNNNHDNHCSRINEINGIKNSNVNVVRKNIKLFNLQKVKT